MRWRDDQSRQRAQTFKLKRDAEAFEAKVVLAKRSGIVDDLDAGKVSFSAFTSEWWKLHGDALAPKTRQVYKSLLKNHLTPKLSGTELRRINTRKVSGLQAQMLKDGVGRETTRKTIALLQGMLERAVEWGRIPYNPARSVKKPSQARDRPPNRIEPKTVEKIRRDMIEKGLHRDAAMVSLLAYAGLRPGEMLALTWGDVGTKSISVTKAVSMGEVRGTKTGAERTVALLKPLASDLDAWRARSAKVNDTSAGSLLFPKKGGGVWTDADFRNWRKRHYAPVARDAGVPSPRPYDLRHSFVSLLFVEHRNPVEIAAMLGHSPDTLFKDYAGVIAELAGQRKRSATTIIETARKAKDSN